MAERSPGHRPLLVSTGVRASAARSPDKVALSTTMESLTYAALVGRMNRIAHLARHGLGLPPGARVAVMAPNSIAFMELVLGLSDAGLATVVIPPGATAAEIGHIVADAAPLALFVHATLAERAAGSGIARVVATGPAFEALLAAAADVEPAAGVAESDTFMVVYTSGTTGRPKGVVIPHRSRTAYMLLAMAANQGRSRPEMRALAVAPIAFGAGFVNALAPIWFGGSCHIMDRFDAEAVLRCIDERRITTIFLVPTHFHAIFDLPPATLARYDVTCLETIVAGAAAMPQATKERIVAHFGEGRLFEGYGSTEAGGVTGLRPEDQLTRPGSVGRALTAVELRILDEDGAPVPTGGVGEVVCRSPMLFDGYLNQPEATEAVLQDGWFHTGDLGRLDAEGYLSIAGRRKTMIITGGQNVFPREVEDVLHHHPGVAEAAVVGQPDAYWGEAVVAYVVPAAGAAPDAAALKAHCAAVLAGYKVPKAFHLVDALPKNASGKILHRALRAPVAQP